MPQKLKVLRESRTQNTSRSEPGPHISQLEKKGGGGGIAERKVLSLARVDGNWRMD